jgi:DNA-binding transcriptional LysR family regulator
VPPYLVRQERRLPGLTDVGSVIVEEASEILTRAAQLKSVAAGFDSAAASQLTVATITFTRATRCYRLSRRLTDQERLLDDVNLQFAESPSERNVPLERQFWFRKGRTVWRLYASSIFLNAPSS